MEMEDAMEVTELEHWSILRTTDRLHKMLIHTKPSIKSALLEVDHLEPTELQKLLDVLRFNYLFNKDHWQ